ncbi:MAG: LppX_LprAFG lipoprotein [Chloroflexota bacterium]|nr:LppX_LprAFG lipoprotein [Chloroflexota bacterium]
MKPRMNTAPIVGMLLALTTALALGACGGSKATPTANAPAPALATVAATALPPTLPPATATVIPPTPIPPTVIPPTAIPVTPTPLAGDATALAATGTALSATSNAFVGSPTPNTVQSVGPPSDPQSQAIVDKARTRFDQVNTLHFTVAIDGDVYLDKLRTQKLKSAEGDLVRPDKVSLIARAQVGPINAQLKFIQIGDNAYLTNILTGKWENAPSGFAYDPRIVFDQDRGVAAILSKVTGWQPADSVKINGADTQHVRAPVPVGTVNDLVSSSLRGDTVDVDLYIEPKNNDVVRLVLTEQPGAVTAGTTAARWTLDLSKQNSNITIDAPTIGG